MPRRTVVVVNRHNVARNRKCADPADRLPVFRISRGRKTSRHWYVPSGTEIAPGVRLWYEPEDPLGCGATAWIEIDGA